MKAVLLGEILRGRCRSRTQSDLDSTVGDRPADLIDYCKPRSDEGNICPRVLDVTGQHWPFDVGQVIHCVSGATEIGSRLLEGLTTNPFHRTVVELHLHGAPSHCPLSGRIYPRYAGLRE